MKFDLLDFQDTAARALLAEIRNAQKNYDFNTDILGAVVLEAATGAGKTVIATWVIERLLFGSDEIEPVEGTTVLWVTNDPSLNVQTARKMQEASEKISDIRFIGQGATLNQRTLDPGVVYFLNTQAASSAARITRKSESQDWTIWETISNTVEELGSRFIVVVDEAHYGVTEKPGGSPTVVNKIINGDRPIPVFVGISATAQRLNKALEQQNRLKRNVEVPIEAVRDSGLVKDRIALAPAASVGDVVADTTFVRLAVRKTLEYERRWFDFCEAQGIPPVKPALVVQLPDQRADDGAFQDLLHRVVEALIQEWPGLRAVEIVHTFAEHAPVDLGTSRVIRYMAPQDIQDATEVRVVLAKNAITTGWDCPRAEVLVSLRASSDSTPIAQLIGRIVRQPLARRIAADETLNRVHAFLPRFDRKTVMDVVGQFSGGAPGSTAEIVRLTLGYEADAGQVAALDLLATLPTYTVPAQAPSPEVRRLHALASLLDNDGIRPGAFAQATQYLNDKLDAEAAKLATGGELAKRRDAISSASIYEILVSVDGSVIDGERQLAGTRLDAKNVDDIFRRATRALKDGTAEAYWAHLVSRDEDADPVEAKITVAALALTDQVVANVEAAAASLTADWFSAHAKAIAFLTETERDKYARLLAQAKGPALRPGLTISGTIEDAVSISTASDKPDDEVLSEIRNDSENRWSKHLYVDSDGAYWKKPTTHDGLEREVLTAELADPTLVGWYRNPAGGDRALCIPYRDSGTGTWSRLFPDFVFFHTVGDVLRPSILDPHGIQLEDWNDKLVGYLDYADAHAGLYRAIAPITRIDGRTLLLALHDEALRTKVRAALSSSWSVEAIFRSHGIAY